MATSDGVNSGLRDRIRNLLDLHAPLTATEEALLKEMNAPQPAGPTIPAPVRSLAPHPAGCWCEACWNLGLEVGLYLQKKRLFDQNGF